MDYLREWAETQCDLYWDDDPLMTDGEKITNRLFLKDNFKKYMDILETTTLDMIQFEADLMDVRTNIADTCFHEGGDELE